MVQKHLQGIVILLETMCLDISGSSREATDQPPACLHIWNSGDRLCHSGVSASLWVQRRLEAILTKQLELKDSGKKKFQEWRFYRDLRNYPVPRFFVRALQHFAEDGSR